jgi:hypothetical protein
MLTPTHDCQFIHGCSRRGLGVLSGNKASTTCNIRTPDDTYMASGVSVSAEHRIKRPMLIAGLSLSPHHSDILTGNIKTPGTRLVQAEPRFLVPSGEGNQNVLHSQQRPRKRSKSSKQAKPNMCFSSEPSKRTDYYYREEVIPLRKRRHYQHYHYDDHPHRRHQRHAHVHVLPRSPRTSCPPSGTRVHTGGSRASVPSAYRSTRGRAQYS